MDESSSLKRKCVLTQYKIWMTNNWQKNNYGINSSIIVSLKAIRVLILKVEDGCGQKKKSKKKMTPSPPQFGWWEHIDPLTSTIFLLQWWNLTLCIPAITTTPLKVLLCKSCSVAQTISPSFAHLRASLPRLLQPQSIGLSGLTSTTGIYPGRYHFHVRSTLVASCRRRHPSSITCLLYSLPGVVAHTPAPQLPLQHLYYQNIHLQTYSPATCFDLIMFPSPTFNFFLFFLLQIIITFILHTQQPSITNT